jgi:hypothetical protein
MSSSSSSFASKIYKAVIFGLFIVFLIVNILDILSTIVGLSMGLLETNWLVQYIAPSIGLLGAFFVVKGLFVGLVFFSIFLALRTRSRIDDDFVIGGLLILNVIGFFVLSNNFSYIH